MLLPTHSVENHQRLTVSCFVGIHSGPDPTPKNSTMKKIIYNIVFVETHTELRSLKQES